MTHTLAKKPRVLLPLIALLLLACDSSAQKSGAASDRLGLHTLGAEKKLSAEQLGQLSTAYFAGGCFWCIEAVFERVEGVAAVVSGYAGGTTPNPTYRNHGDHAEAVKILYDPEVVSYATLLEIFFDVHDPTQLNRQGPDVGESYRSGVYYQTDQERQLALQAMAQVDVGPLSGDSVVTEVKPLGTFTRAEEYHQDYYEDPTNPNQGYVQNVSRPKVTKFVSKYQDKLKPEYQKQAQP